MTFNDPYIEAETLAAGLDAFVDIPMCHNSGQQHSRIVPVRVAAPDWISPRGFRRASRSLIPAVEQHF
jgi:predicted CxxxxCH...CXXCH cytochrome family protein